MRTTMSAAGLVTVLALAACGSADPAERGLSLLTDNCARCHAVGTSGASPRAEAPPFRELGQRYPLVYLEEALAEGIMTGHNDMPLFVFGPAEIADVMAYLATIQTGTPAPAPL